MSAANLTRTGALRTLLLGTSPIYDVVTTGGVSRITPPPLDPKTTYPALVIQELNGRELESMDGVSNMIRTLFQLTCWDKSHVAAYALRELVKAALMSYKGSAGSYYIAGSNHAGDHELRDGKLEAYQLITSFQIWWSR